MNTLLAPKCPATIFSEHRFLDAAGDIVAMMSRIHAAKRKSPASEYKKGTQIIRTQTPPVRERCLSGPVEVSLRS